MNLYTLSTELEILQAELLNEDNSEDQIKLIEERIIELLDKQENKYENILKIRANKLAQAKMLQDEIERLQKKLKPLNNTVERLENYLDESLRLNGIQTLEVWTFSLSYRQSESVEIENEWLLPAEFVKIKETRSPDKIAIKKAIKDGQQVTGATVKTNLNLQIK